MEESVNLREVPEGAVMVHDIGFVKHVSTYGTDDDIAQAARLSYGRGTNKVRDNTGLINYLYRNSHTSPFEMVEIKFQIRMPIFVMRQWVRHRTANLNEYSGRYSEMPRMWYTPEASRIKAQHDMNKQASGNELSSENQKLAEEVIWNASNEAFNAYEYLLNLKVSREMARIVLPLNTYTEVVWKMDLHNMLHFLKLRDDSHAQPEIQDYAKVIAEFVQRDFPLAYAAYEDWKASTLMTPDELQALIQIAVHHNAESMKNLSKSQRAKINQIFELYR